MTQVYSTQRSRYWHMSDKCGRLQQGKTPRQVSIEYAEAGGRTPCRDCAAYRTMGRGSSHVAWHNDKTCSRLKPAGKGRYVHQDSAKAAGLAHCLTCNKGEQ